ncbi:hypothetical protein F383_27612 [Gossypium arboreum]|uniref:Uncharacterized protein n=1 Tax=Gossypium arboreum TaxID=29729 RepID=A0A0B0MNU2_GOSAR|nr:hypothetical protein F383_27612 [Gossypium arboreum]
MGGASLENPSKGSWWCCGSLIFLLLVLLMFELIWCTVLVSVL